MGSLGMLSQLICLSVPITWPVQLSVAVCGLIPWISKKFRSDIQDLTKRIYDQQLFIQLVFICLFALTIVLAAGPIIRDDTESYHLQSIKWMHEYGTVNGIANLHARYGFNSTWLSLISIITPKTNLNFYTSCNAILSLLVCSSLLHQPRREGELRSNSLPLNSGLVMMAFLLSIWYYWRGNSQSTNYDYFFLAFCLIGAVQSNQKLISANQLLLVFLIAPPLLFCIRPIYAPLMLLSLYSIIKLNIQNQKATLFKTSLFYGIFITMFLWRNIQISGYVLFPSTWIDITNVKWKMPKEYVTIQWEYINNYTWDRSLNIIDAGLKWLKGLYLYDRILVLFGIISIVFLTTRKTKLSVRIILHCSLFLMLTLWLFVSPEPRFISGIFFTSIFMTLSQMWPRINQLYYLKWLITICTSATLIITPLFIVIQKLTKEGNAYTNLITPAEIPSPNYNTISTDDFKVNLPDKISKNWNKRCYLTPLPCVYDSVPGVRLIGNTIKEGFYVDYVAPRKISEN